MKAKTEDPETHQLPPLGEVLEFMRLMWAIDHGLQSISKRMTRTLQVTGPQRMVLRIVGRFPGISAGQLARVLHLHPSTVTGLVQRLGAAGLLERRTDPKDGRRVRLGLTAEGRRLDVPATGTVEAAVERVLAELPRRTTDAARELLSALCAALEEKRGQDLPRNKKK